MQKSGWLGALVLSCLGLAAGSASADKLYKWTDAQGNVHYTQQEPAPAEAKKQERRRFGDKPADVTLPYALQQAIKNFPVTLYTADCGDACTKAAAMLSERGVPFSEKNARESAAGEELKALTGKLEVPVLKLGSHVVRGWEETSWTQALDAAGYPRTAVIPRKVAEKVQPGKKPSGRKANAAKTEEPKPDAAAPDGDKPEQGKDEKQAAPAGGNSSQ
jgi:glutaredoxin